MHGFSPNKKNNVIYKIIYLQIINDGGDLKVGLLSHYVINDYHMFSIALIKFI